MKRIIWWWGGFLLVLVMLSGCNPPTRGDCTPGDLVQPQIITPAGTMPKYLDWDSSAGVVNPGVIAWDFPSECTPDSFVVEFYHHDLNTPMYQETLPGTATSWPQSQINEPFFEPGQHYLVHVYAVARGESGEYGATGIWTEPQCASASEMMTLEAFAPENGAVVREPVILHYEQPSGGCVPSGYAVEITTSPSRTIPDVQNEVYSLPGTFIIFEEGTFTPCTPYFWRVAPVYDGIYGPFTPYRVFQVQGDDVACLPYAYRPPEMPDIASQLPCASADQLVQPELLTPEFMGYIGTQAVDGLYVGLFTWQYTGTCLGDGYHLEIIDSLDETHPVISVDTTDTSWPPGGSTVTALQPAKKYYWQVAATLNGEQGPSKSSIFFTGPRCTDPQEALPPEPVSPADGTIITNTQVTIEWNWTPQTCLPHGIALELSTEPTFSGVTDMHLYPLATEAARLDNLKDCTVYYWRVSTYVVPPYSDLITSLPSESRWFMMADNLSICRLRRIPAVSLQPLTCLQGPSPAYPLVTNLKPGTQFFVTGRSEDGDWLVANNDTASWQCWAPASGIEVRGPISALDIIAPPPVPVEPPPESPPDSGGNQPPPACSYNLPKDQCEASGGSWYTGIAAAPHCVCPYP